MKRFSLAVALCAACAPGNTGGPGGGPDGGDDVDSGTAPTALFDVERIVAEGAAPLGNSGLGLAVRGDGRWAVAYAAPGTGQYTCPTFTGTGANGGDNVDIMVVDEQLDGSHRVRLVETVMGIKPGSIDLAIDPSTDALVVVYPAGASENGYCGAADLGMAVESGDTFTTSLIATSASTGATCRYEEDPFCEMGGAVGFFPAVAVDANGTIAVAYQDLHFGFADKDLNGADLELARGPAGGLALQTLSPEVGGGYNSSIAFGPDGRIIAGHAVVASNEFPNPDGGTFTIEKGVYAVVEQDDGTILEHAIAQNQNTDARVAVAWHPSKGFFAAYHDIGSDDVYLYNSVDDGATWTADPVDQIGRTGRDPQLAFLQDGTLLVAYGHCGSGTGTGCPRSEDGVKVAIKEGGQWKKQLLPGDDEELEGKNVDLAVSGEHVAVASLDTSTGEIIVHVLVKK